MTYTETLDYIFHKLPMFSRVGAAAYKKDLTNTIALCSHLGNPQHKFKSIHVGGTNGKGSTSHMLAAILQSAGYKTGLYTSPHLYDFRERIKVDGVMISEAAVVSFVERMIPMIDLLEPSFFEITVAMAFEHFAQEGVEVAVIEVGLGGRLDSTNIIQPEISVITNISLDHIAMLGDTKEKIAFEKAGIIKRGTPVVIGERSELTDPVFMAKAQAEAAPILFAPDKYETLKFEWEAKGLMLSIQKKNTNAVRDYLLDLQGIYQTKNSCTVLAAVDVLNDIGFEISNSVLRQGLARTKELTGLQGRWDILNTQPMMVADVAHNEAGIKEVLHQLESMQYKNLHLVIGMVKDKAIDDVLHLLPTNATYYFTQASIPRALAAGELQQQAEKYQLTGVIFPSVNEAIGAARNACEAEDLILICGSIFLIAEIDKSQFSN